MKIGILVFSIIIVVIAARVVYLNSGSEKLLSSSLSVVLLGSLGLMISAFVTLKETKVENKTPLVIFLSTNPIQLPYYAMELNEVDILASPLINNYLKPEYVDSDFSNKSDPEKLCLNITERWIIDLMHAKYSYHWQTEGLFYETPFGTRRSNYNPNPNDEWKPVYLEEIHRIFKSNELFSLPEVDESKRKFPEFIVPPKTNITVTRNNFSSKIVIDNPFIEIELNFIVEQSARSTVPDKRVAQAFGIDDWEKYHFQPIILHSKITTRKWRSGHTCIDKYENWATGLVELITDNLSIDKFWHIVKSNQ